MWPFSKKTSIAASGILAGAADHHSHILPGVDDGVETMDEVLHILQKYEKLGIKVLWLTPHIMEDIPNTVEKLQARFEELKAAYSGSIELNLAAEYMIDNNLRKLLQDNCPSCVRGASNAVAEGDEKSKPCHSESQKGISLSSPSSLKREYPQGEGDGGNHTSNNCPSLKRGTSNTSVAEGDRASLLPIGAKGKHLLVETSYFNPPMRLRETLRQIKSLGYYPLLAHPERYLYMDNDEYRRLREEGIKFQLNIVSLAGGYGKAVKKRAQWLLTNGFYSVCGSDLHSEHAIEYITECKLTGKEIEELQKLMSTTLL